MPALLCRKCGFNNPPGMRFCGNCGSKLGATGALEMPPAPPVASAEQVGVMMGADLLERFRQAGLEAAGQRRNVTLLFADLSGFTGLSQRLDTEELFVLVQQFDGLMARSIYKYEGMVDKFIGDGVMAIFGAPIAQENNAEMAIRAALDMQQQIAEFSAEVQERYGSEELRLHIGLHTGTVIVGSLGSSLMMNYTAIGDTVNLAARLQQNADPGTILVSQVVYQFARPLFDFEPLAPLALKGYTFPVPAFRLIGTRAAPGSLRGIEGLTAPLIGRDNELATLRAAADRLIDKREGRFVLLEGDAGIGKSRLTNELRAYLRPLPVRVLVGQSYTYRRTLAYWIFQDVLRGLFGLKQNAVEPLALATIKARLTRLMGAEANETIPYIYYMLSIGLDLPEVSERTRYLDAAQLRQRVFLAVRQVLMAEAFQSPIWLVLEDLHWADETSLDLLAYLIDIVSEAPLVFQGISRQYEEDNLGGLVQKVEQRLGERCLHLRLTQLSPEQSEKLLAELLAISGLPATLHEQIVQRSAGNPLYLEEILRMLIDERKIFYQDGRWELAPGIADAGLGVPDTLQGLILARFDRLDPDLRRVLQVAAVIGRNFSSAVLADILRQEELSQISLADILKELDQRGFILPQTGVADFDYSFKHVLVSDAIYSSLLKVERSELHGQVAEAFETLYADRTSEFVEMLARHYAWSTRSDRALHYLILAGQQEARNYANQQARQSFEQAIAILSRIDHTPQQEFEAYTGMGEVLVFTGDYPAALQNYQAALDALDGMDHVATLLDRSRLLRKLSIVHERQGNYDQALAVLALAKAAINEASHPDPVELAWISNTIGWIYLRRGNLDQANQSLQYALRQVDGLPEYDVIASIYNRLGGLFYQKGELEEASLYVSRSLELRQRIGDVNAVARSYNNLGLLNWRRGNWNSALQNFKRSVELHGTLGDVEGTIEINSNLGLVYLEQGDLENAFHSFEHALQSAQKIGHSYHIGLSYLHLARYSLFCEDWPRAVDYCQRSQKIFDEIGVSEHRVTLEIYSGLAQLGMGDLAAARSASKNALELSKPADSAAPTEERGYALRLSAQVERAHGVDLTGVAETLRQCISLFETVGSQVEQARSEVLLAGVVRALGDADAARDLLAKAHKTFEQLGARLDLDRL